MREFQEKKKFDRLLYSKIVIGLLSIILLVLISAVVGSYTKYSETKENRWVAIQEMARLEEREAAIRKEIERLANSRGVEEEIRKKFGFVKTGERVIVITESPYLEGGESGGESGQNFLGNLWSSISRIFY